MHPRAATIIRRSRNPSLLGPFATTAFRLSAFVFLPFRARPGALPWLPVPLSLQLGTLSICFRGSNGSFIGFGVFAHTAFLVAGAVRTSPARIPI